MRGADSSPVIRQRMNRLKKRKMILRRQRTLREQISLSKERDIDLVTDKAPLPKDFD
jgi:hypothetical protein